MSVPLLVKENSSYYTTKYKGHLIYASKEEDGSWKVLAGSRTTKTQNINKCLESIMNSIDSGSL